MENHLLAALDTFELQQWQEELEPVKMQVGQVIYESSAKQRHIYFPTTAIVSLMYVTENGDCSEIGVVGFEGVVGVSVFMGGDATHGRAIVKCAGDAFRVSTAWIRSVLEKPMVMRLFLQYIQALFTQIAQTAVCNRHHVLDQQFCRLLLSTLDRTHGEQLLITQESISDTLGVRRESVTDAAIKLQKAGLIKYARGRITVLNRAGLESRACECYGVVRKEFTRLFPRHPNLNF